jgi:hypothetical protein
MVFRCYALRGAQIQTKLWALPAVKLWKILMNKVIINIYLLIGLYVTLLFFRVWLSGYALLTFIYNYIVQLKRKSKGYHVWLQSDHPNIDLSLNIRIFMLHYAGVKETLYFFSIVKPTCCNFYSIYLELNFERYLFISRRRHTSGIWHIACVVCQLATPALMLKLQPWCSQHTYYACYTPIAVCVAPPEDEQVVLETCRGP